MGGVCSDLCMMQGELCMLLCRHKCRPSSVASMLTFRPPEPPYYELQQRDQEGGQLLEWLVDVQVMHSPFTDVRIYLMKTRRGSLIPGFYFRNPSGTAPLTIIFSHGNAADCGVMREQYIQLVQRVHCNVFAYDYTGYGASSGTPSEADTYADICAAYDHLVSNNICPRPSEQIVLYGQSVGSGPSCKLASSKNRPIRGMILHSPIMSGIRVLMNNRGPLACCDIYPNINRIRKVRAPVLIIHGDRDEEVGFHHGERLYEKIPEEHKHDPCWVKGAGHNDIVEDFPDQYYPKVAQFLRTLEADEQAEEGGVTEVLIGGKKRPAAEMDQQGKKSSSSEEGRDQESFHSSSSRTGRGEEALGDSQVVLT